MKTEKELRDLANDPHAQHTNFGDDWQDHLSAALSLLDESRAALVRLRDAVRRAAYADHEERNAKIMLRPTDLIERVAKLKAVSEERWAAWDALSVATDATPTDLADAQRREWLAQGMEEVADIVDSRLAERCLEMRAHQGCSGRLMANGTLRRCAECFEDLDPADVVMRRAAELRGGK